MSGYIVCLMCKAKLIYVEEDPSHYKSHLKYHHGAYYNHNVILALNLLDKTFFQTLYDEFVKEGHKPELTGVEMDCDEAGEVEESDVVDVVVTVIVLPGEDLTHRQPLIGRVLLTEAVLAGHHYEGLRLV